MTQNELLLISSSETTLKSTPVRNFLERRVAKHLRIVLSRHGEEPSISRKHGRIVVTNLKDMSRSVASASRVFGVASVIRAVETSTERNAIVDQAVCIGIERIKPGSFAVRARRLGDHEFTSKELENIIGSRILEAVGRSAIVNLSKPDTTVYVEVKEDCTYVYTQRIEGPGGLPYGCQGSVVSLFSGSPNSCVSTWLLMKRGARIIPMYFEEGFNDDTAKDSAIRWLRLIHSTLPARKVTLVVVPFKEVLEGINRCGQPGLSKVLRQRAMLMAADNVAQEMSALGIVTGDALSGHRHDMERLVLSSLGVSTPIYRPLAGLQKDEILEFGKKSQVCNYSYSGEGESSFIEMSLDLQHELELSSDTVSLLKSALASRQTVELLPAESSTEASLPDHQCDSV